ncbi:MAG: nucleotide pyrophosphatase/phosphodiesterase family protein [Planctomycetota bacterium]
MQPTVIINVVALSESLLGDHAPRLTAFAAQHGQRHLQPVLPAVTCTAQSAMVTGRDASDHGIVGNGWFNRTMNEVQFWNQSNALVNGEKIWDRAKAEDPNFTCANMFWWYNMYSSADMSVTPRPQYKADGRKVPDVYSYPADLRDELQRELGQFPLFNFWGPASSITSSQWIADASMHVQRRFNPTLMLVYLPHLDYGLQKLGPVHDDVPALIREIDDVVGACIDHFEAAGYRVLIVSEYGIEPVDRAIEVNRVLRREGLLRVRTEDGGELLDAGASDAFAVADHQIAHVYVRDASNVSRVASLCEAMAGVDEVLDRSGQRDRGLAHDRAGELVLVAKPRHWFAYHYWLDEARAPDFARTVDIHRKPGYDPLELFIDPSIALPKVRIISKLIRKKLGFRTLMDVIPTDPALVKGSHGRDRVDATYAPIMLGPTSPQSLPFGETLPMTAVSDVLWRCLTDTS